MPPWFHHNKNRQQFLFGIESKHPIQFRMDNLVRIRRHSEVDDSGSGTFDKHQIPVIPVAGHQNASQFPCNVKQFFVCRPRQAKLTNGNNIMATSSQKAPGSSVDILIEKKLHAASAVT